jgi:hypothetical protein
MSLKLVNLVARQRELQVRAAQERTEFALHFEPIEKSLSWADKGIDAFNLIRSRPIIWTSAFAVLVHYKPKVASKVLAVGWGAIKLLKSTKNLL